MDQQESTGGIGRDDMAVGDMGGTGHRTGTPGAGMAGAANTPSFGAGEGALATAADHQIPSETGAGGSSGQGGEGASGGQASEVKQRLGEVGEQAKERVNAGMQQAAGRIETAARQLDSFADQRLSGDDSQVKRRAGEMTHGLADTMDSLASYLRDNDAAGLQRDLENQVRQRPLQTLLIAVAAGWVVGKILR